MNMEDSSVLIPLFPNEISENILVRLPVKDLVRLSCVSKPWYDLIFSKHGVGLAFSRFHAQHPARESPRKVWLKNYLDPLRVSGTSGGGPAFCLGCNNIPDTDGKQFAKASLRKDMGWKSFLCSQDKFFNLGNNICVVGYVDGVFCLVKDCACESDVKIYLWNPALRQSILLPRSMDFDFLTIAVGFGYDSVTHDYMVAKFYSVKVHTEKNMVTYKADVYSLKKHSWATLLYYVDEVPKYSGSYRHTPGINQACVILNGYLYWNIGYNEQGQVHISYVHLTQLEDFGCVLVPDYVIIRGGSKLRIHNELLSLSGFTSIGEFELWSRADHLANVWVKQFCIPTSLGFMPYSCMTDVSSDGRILGYIDQQRDGRGLLAVYDPESEVVEFVKDKANTSGSISGDYFLVGNYAESLVSVVPYSPIGERRFDESKTKSFAEVLFRRLWGSLS